jgi:pyruvate formate lyase activating enzyme
MKESYLYKKLKNNSVQCQTCNHNCIIQQGKRGICGVRENIDGKLNLLVYGKIVAMHIDPIEKKPFYHFLPGTYSLSIATVGCNFHCQWCQNWEISQATKNQKIGYKLKIKGKKIKPEQVVQEAIRNDCPSISYTYTEPTIFLEFALDTMKLARSEGIKNTWVSNGYFTDETLELIAPYLDAINIDLKSFSEKNYQKFCGAKLKPVLENIKKVHDKKIHLEITTLLIPKVNDSIPELKKIAKFIAGIDVNIPWHISRFFPAYKTDDLPRTPKETMEKAVEIGEKTGLKNVYFGNMWE